MTGFASAIVEIPISKTEKISLSMNMKALNSRYFEATCKLPYLLSNTEVSIQRILKKKLERGHIYLTIKVQQDATRHIAIPSRKTIEEYLNAINEIQSICKIKEPVSLGTILQLPNIFQIEEESLQGSAEEKILLAIEKLTDDLIKTRISEGKILALDIVTSIKEASKKLLSIKKASVKVFQKKKAELETLINKLNNVPIEEVSVKKCMLDNQKNVLISELEKIDIHEEEVRATAHTKSIIALLKEEVGPKGKKLDFTLQELNREINTIASKCSHSEISALTIDIKADIEKAREQAQNIV